MFALAAMLLRKCDWHDDEGVALLLAALVGMILLQEFVAPRHTQTLTYSEFKQALMAGKLDDVVIADGIATGKLRAEGLEQILPKEKLEVLKRAGGV